MNTITSTDGDKWSEDYPYVVSGHIHGRQMVGKNIYYPGTPHQTRFGESLDKTVSLFKVFSDGRREVSRVSLGLPTKRILKVDSSEMSTFTLPESKDTEFKVEISGSIEEFKTFMKGKEYRTLSKKCVVVFKARQSDTEVQIPDSIDINDSFLEVLKDLVDEEKNPLLGEIFVELTEEDVLFL